MAGHMFYRVDGCSYTLVTGETGEQWVEFDSSHRDSDDGELPSQKVSSIPDFLAGDAPEIAKARLQTVLSAKGATLGTDPAES